MHRVYALRSKDALKNVYILEFTWKIDSTSVQDPK